MTWPGTLRRPSSVSGNGKSEITNQPPGSKAARTFPVTRSMVAALVHRDVVDDQGRRLVHPQLLHNVPRWLGQGSFATVPRPAGQAAPVRAAVTATVV